MFVQYNNTATMLRFQQEHVDNYLQVSSHETAVDLK